MYATAATQQQAVYHPHQQYYNQCYTNQQAYVPMTAPTPLPTAAAYYTNTTPAANVQQVPTTSPAVGQVYDYSAAVANIPTAATAVGQQPATTEIYR